ncbi:FUSC family protein [Streptomyces sp. NBC_01174]|uniref:FUSC family protein n=1 Tax=Streptomyces sp. NBC_01174 TaxID=2903758 RepID=UPI00386A6808|nr:FUSC family protein [Streptomyces sp. NBC_01177]WSS73599.1 FUSC family protein [Streptomyces sp. NBC_01175]WSS81146.1 FUSC family protein [Streptomyces sp. NBC_01174]
MRPWKPSVHALPVTGVLRLNSPAEIWYKPALSVVVASAVPNLLLYSFDRLDLVMYTMAGSLCALYGHNLPYARRVHTVLRVILGMAAGLAVALVVGSLTDSTAVLIAVGALLAAVQKTFCDATRIGPPGNVIFAFVTSAALFAPQELGQVPGHMGLMLAAGAFSWLVTVGPALWRREGPERLATARALDAAAAYAADPGPRTRHAAAAAVQGAWQSLLAAGRPTAVRQELERLVVHAERALMTTAADGAGPEELRRWAAGTRARGPVPCPPPAPGTVEQLFGIDAERAGQRMRRGRREARRRLLRALGPGSPVLPVAFRTLVGCALAGYVSSALGVGHPYWAIVTAASVYQPNLVLSWSRALQRTVGNLLGVLVFAAVIPLARLDPLVLVLCVLFFNFAAEALITRNYWLGSVAVTPMALLILEFGGFQPAGELVADRALDTLVGVAVGFLAAIAVTNRRASGRVERALAAAVDARHRAELAVADPAVDTLVLETARRRLTASLVELRDAGDVASGEWWQRALPEEELLAAEQAGHRTLAATAQRQGLITLPPTSGAV